MYNHEPQGYVCSFCSFVRGAESELNKLTDIIYQDEAVFAYMSPRWWVNNSGNVLVIPKRHIEHIYDIDEATLTKVYALGKRVAAAMKDTYHCDGTLFRQHNEPGGGQEVLHFHLHVFPRYVGDNLYQNHDQYRYVSAEERRPYAEKLRKALVV